MKNNFIYDFERYDYLDYFLNKAYWHNLMSTSNLKMIVVHLLKVLRTF